MVHYQSSQISLKSARLQPSTSRSDSSRHFNHCSVAGQCQIDALNPKFQIHYQYPPTNLSHSQLQQLQHVLRPPPPLCLRPPAHHLPPPPQHQPNHPHCFFSKYTAHSIWFIANTSWYTNCIEYGPRSAASHTPPSPPGVRDATERPLLANTVTGGSSGHEREIC
ncbi:hypothetical protein JAAARDRAFT_413037 [Jaapia argillacea MUCL 33604]|uniref:Uncharacterized protein n=1 Tax=Jaapia argillacea MUCL 33604 TaxID=933084 RepID=A0A067PS74_9AGAM|nr:hypothetical protein JAAARDRAFT_413037 [Jaapia argillacea MUCL 33604]